MHAVTLTRREMIKNTAACVGLVFVPSLRGAPEPADTAKPAFKIGVVDWELSKPGDPEAVALAAQLGFDGLQVDLADVESFRKPELQDRYQQLTRKYPIQIASLALGKLSDTPYGTDPKGQTLVDAAIDVAHAMKQKILLLAFFGRNGLEKPENKLDALVGRLKENAPKAEKNGVVLGLEGEATAERYKEIIDRVGSSAVKVYFDCVHAHEERRDIFQEITLLGDRICEFHAKDYGNILFGQGTIDWHAVRRGMDAIGYRGWLQVEQWGEVKGPKPLGIQETHRRNLKYLRQIFPAQT
ncbi:MAG TPA: sugar phosphate isomerase/epimerase family protein [Verrucomicrobiae bacterium]